MASANGETWFLGMRYTGDGMSSLRFLSQILVETLKTGSLELFGTLFSFLVNFWNFFIAWLPLASMACVLDCIGLASMNGDYSWLPPSIPAQKSVPAVCTSPLFLHDHVHNRSAIWLEFHFLPLCFWGHHHSHFECCSFRHQWFAWLCLRPYACFQ